MSHATRPIGILGLGTCVPERVLSNADLEKMVETSDEWIRTRTGITERRILRDDQMPADLAEAAARAALANAGLTPADIDGVIYATYTADHVMPPCSSLLHGRLGIPGGMTFDLNAACSGFVTGLQTGFSLVNTGVVKRALVLGVDCNSRMLDYTDRETCVLFGDGAGAVVVGEVPAGRGILGNATGADGSGSHLITQRIGPGALPALKEDLTTKDRFIRMNGREVYKFAVKVINEALEKACADAGISPSEIELLVPHQANVRIIQSAMDRFGFAPEKVVINMDRYGNTSAASIPLALETARADGRLRPGMVIALVAFGAGLTYGASVMRW